MTKVIVFGYLNTDIIASGLARFPDSGELVQAKKITIGPGGKSRNIADMTARLCDKDTVLMIGKTVKDSFGLWRPAIESLETGGVNTDFIIYDEDTSNMPGIAMIPVNKTGENQIILIPGVNETLSAEDIFKAESVFQQAEFVVLTLECTKPAMQAVFELAKKYGAKILFDPGGISSTNDISQYLQNIYVIKPNEHEIKLLTGVEVVNEVSAFEAAQILLNKGTKYVMITVGDKGAYLFGRDMRLHLPVDASIIGDDLDATGCGDQTMAAICAGLISGQPIEEAARVGVAAGTLQFHRLGVQPLEKHDIFDNV